MAIILDEDNKVVTVENEPEAPRALFKNLPEASTIEGGVGDVLIDGASIVDENGDANIPTMSSSVAGVARLASTSGLQMDGDILKTQSATADLCKAGANNTRAIVPANQSAAFFYGMAKAAGDATQAASANAIGNYTDEAKSKISQMLSGSVEVSGTTPAITALPGIRYICGEVATLDITLPESGCIDVVFTSGSTPTVLTITPPTGQTVKWTGGFDPTSLNTDTIYELNIYNSLGVAGSWT